MALAVGARTKELTDLSVGARTKELTDLSVGARIINVNKV
jgi:hypothetical protein